MLFDSFFSFFSLRSPQGRFSSSPSASSVSSLLRPRDAAVAPERGTPADIPGCFSSLRPAKLSARPIPAATGELRDAEAAAAGAVVRV